MTGIMEMAWYIDTIFKNDKKSKLYDELDKLSTQELLSEFDKTMNGELIKDSARYDVIQGVLADRLHLVPRDLILKFLWEEFSADRNRIDELEEQFKNHRHNLDKTYSEKPVW